MDCDYCEQQMSYCFYINDAHWIKVVGEERFDKNEGRVCAHCTLERLGGLGWYVIWNEPTENVRRQQLAGSHEALNEAGERWDDDYGLDPRHSRPTPGEDGRCCQHRDDDPAHGKECYEPRTDREVVESLAITLAQALCNGGEKTKRQKHIRDLLIEFADEIKRQAVEP